MLNTQKAVFDKALQSLLLKIDEKKVTCEDFNSLIRKTVIGETSPEAVRDRLRRRTIKNVSDTHQDNVTGHQQLTLPTFDGRIKPKVKPSNQQNHGRSKLAHKHSARTQHLNHLKEMFDFIVANSGKPLTEQMLNGVGDRKFLVEVAKRLLKEKDVDRDWLYGLIRSLDNDN